MKPLLDLLRDKNIQYRWKYPFAVQVTYGGKQYTLRTPDELPAFCTNLQLDPILLPDWYAEFLIPQVQGDTPPTPEPSTSYSPHYKKGKHQKKRELTSLFSSPPKTPKTPKNRDRN